MSARFQISLLLTIVAGSLVLVPLSQARIVPEEGRIGQVKLFMSKGSLDDKLGPPDEIKRFRRSDGRVHTRRYIYRKRKLRVDLSARTKSVDEISTRSPRQRTARGSGVGSTRTELEQAEDDRLDCDPDRLEGDCWIQSRGRYSGYFTYFLIEDQQIVEVVIRPGHAPDAHPPLS